MQNAVLFLTLRVFSATGGIEKVSRLAGMALHQLCEEADRPFQLYSLYDKGEERMEKYFPTKAFRGFGCRKAAFVLQSLRYGKTAGTVVLSHINLLPVGYLIKKFSPRTKLVLLAHGIEVWEPLPAWIRRMLRSCDRILAVSRFTREKMLALHGLEEGKMVVVNNCLDPFLPLPAKKERSARLLQKYSLPEGARIVLTLTRLSFRERYKGYDEVLMAVKALKRDEPLLRYLIVGRYDEEEKARLDRLIRQQGLEKEVVFAGYVPDEELAEHFNLADVYAMPSRKEGFGIVFVEALYYGLPVIAGNVDGSVDALADGAFGWLVNPDRPEEIKAALQETLAENSGFAHAPETILTQFGFAGYQQRLGKTLELSTEPGSAGKKKQPVTIYQSKPVHGA